MPDFPNGRILEANPAQVFLEHRDRLARSRAPPAP